MTITPERLAEIRDMHEAGWVLGDATAELLAYVDELTAERDLLKRGGKTLGEIIDRQCRDVIEVTNSQDIIGEDGDGDWEVVWERLHEMRATITTLTTERDSARDLAVRSGVFTDSTGDESWLSHALNEECEHCGNRLIDGACFGCGMNRPKPGDRPSAYDMPVGSVVKTADGSYSKLDDYASGYNWGNDGGSDSIQSEWVESLFTRGLVTEWRVP